MPVLSIAALGLAGLGCANPLTADQIFALAQPRFGSDARIMTQVALRESGGCADAYNGAGESSVGLWQVNLQAHPNAGTVASLQDPVANADAAAALYRSQGLAPWYVGVPKYDALLEPFLSVADQAAIDAGVDPDGGAGTDGLGGGAGMDVFTAVGIGLGLWLLVRALG